MAGTSSHAPFHLSKYYVFFKTHLKKWAYFPFPGLLYPSTGQLKRSFECSGLPLLTLLQNLLWLPSALRTLSVWLLPTYLLTPPLFPDTCAPTGPTLQPHSAPSHSLFPLPENSSPLPLHLSGLSLYITSPRSLLGPPIPKPTGSSPSSGPTHITALITLYINYLVTTANSSIGHRRPRSCNTFRDLQNGFILISLEVRRNKLIK